MIDHAENVVDLNAILHPGSVYDPISARIAEDLGFEVGHPRRNLRFNRKLPLQPRADITEFGGFHLGRAQPGDIVLWNFSHVNFVYTADNGKLTFVGGNQSPKNKGNNPNDGDVTISWPGGWTSAKGGIVGIFRPSKE